MKLLDIVNATSFSYGYRISFLTNFFREPFLRKIDREYGITRPELTILLCLMYREGITQRDICEVTEQLRNSISRAARLLESKGLISQQSDTEDGRRILLNLTQAGRDIHDDFIPLIEQAEQKMLSCLETEEREQLDVLLNKMARAVPNWKD